MRSLKKVLSVIAASMSLVAIAGPTAAAPRSSRPIGAVVEKVVFEGVLPFEQGIVLDRIGVKPGDVLTRSTVERIGRQLLTLRVPRSFSYLAGTKPGQIVLSIGAGC